MSQAGQPPSEVATVGLGCPPPSLALPHSSLSCPPPLHLPVCLGGLGKRGHLPPRAKTGLSPAEGPTQGTETVGTAPEEGRGEAAGRVCRAEAKEHGSAPPGDVTGGRGPAEHGTGPRVLWKAEGGGGAPQERGRISAIPETEEGTTPSPETATQRASKATERAAGASDGGARAPSLGAGACEGGAAREGGAEGGLDAEVEVLSAGSVLSVGLDEPEVCGSVPMHSTLLPGAPFNSSAPLGGGGG